jgi:tetratricopeptide (TPR) repeat protein
MAVARQVSALAVLTWFGAAALLISPSRALAAPDISAQLARAEQDLKTVEDGLVLVENVYAYRPEAPEEEQLRKRFSDAEIQFLLGNYQPASVLFYDLIGSPAFRSMPEYAESMYLLGESLYQLQNYLGARIYFREHMNLKGGHYKESLARYLDISGRVNQFAGIDKYILQAKDATGGIPADLAYVYAKWTYKREDVPKEKRYALAKDTFQQIAQLGGPNAMQAAYFVGTIAVDQAQVCLARCPERDQACADRCKASLNDAAQAFEQVIKLPERTDAERKVHELGGLALGRVLYELGRYSEALDRYQEVDRDSPYFVDALYEISWTYVRKGDFDKAFRAADILLLLAPESTIAPEARILQGHLLLKLNRFNEAIDVYNQVINSYAPVRDEIDALLAVHSDPVKYFDDLLAKNEKNFEVTSLLPPVAVKWATTQQDVTEAVRVVGDLTLARAGVQESRDVVKRLLDILDQRGDETFPDLHEGLERADAADTALARIDEGLLAAETELIGAQNGDLKAELDKAHAEIASLEAKFNALPKSQKDLDARRQRMAQRIDGLEKELLHQSLQVDELFAILAAVQKWDADTRGDRNPDPENEQALVAQIHQEREAAQQLRNYQDQIAKAVQGAKGGMGFEQGDEGKIRASYEQALEKERELISRARATLPAEDQRDVGRIDELRNKTLALRGRSDKAKEAIRVAIRRKGDSFRQKINAEASLLDNYEREVQLVQGDARNLVGRITYASFQRVRREFYDLVLKADVGLVDVAWSRKQDKTNKIQDLSKEKDRELKVLDEDFKEVLKEVE